MSQRTRLLESYSHCRQVVLCARSNLGRAFWLLPDDQRRGMDALYAFARHADDLVDEAGDAVVRRERLRAFRDSFASSIRGDVSGNLLPAVIDTLQRFEISEQHLLDLLDGCAMDLEPARFHTWDDLQRYCYRVASSIGLACLCIWGCRDDAAQQPAIDCGLALQLTNILRDLREDAARGRIYLPIDELHRFKVSEEDILACRATPQTAELIQFQIERARQLYESAARAQPLIPQPARRLFWLMHSTYRRLLETIAREPNVVFQRRIGLSWPTKVWLATRATIGI